MDHTRPSGDEMLEVWDWNVSAPTGKPVARKQAHREGVPHEGVHLWVVRRLHESPEVLFQERAPDKDQYPNCLDITVGGHVPFGTVANKIQKEAFEEIGIMPGDDELIDLGFYKYEERTEILFHREFQHVYLYVSDMPLHEYRFTDAEVTGIYAIPLDFLQTIMRQEASCIVSGYNGLKSVRRKVTRKDFHPLLFAPSMSAYMKVLFDAINELIITGTVKTVMPSIR